MEEYIKTQISKYEFLFSYFKKSTVIGFSYSLTCNGRGYYQKDTLNAIVPFEIDERKYETTFFQAIHEFTHQFTDEIIGKNINMDDGTHGLSEKAAILFDYYLIKNVYPEDLPSFCRWINKTLNINCYDDNSIGHYFPVDSIIKNRLLELINDIREYLSRSEVNG